MSSGQSLAGSVAWRARRPNQAGILTTLHTPFGVLEGPMRLSGACALKRSRGRSPHGKESQSRRSSGLPSSGSPNRDLEIS